MDLPLGAGAAMPHGSVHFVESDGGHPPRVRPGEPRRAFEGRRRHPDRPAGQVWDKSGESREVLGKFWERGASFLAKFQDFFQMAESREKDVLAGLSIFSKWAGALSIQRRTGSFLGECSWQNTIKKGLSFVV